MDRWRSFTLINLNTAGNVNHHPTEPLLNASKPWFLPFALVGAAVVIQMFFGTVTVSEKFLCVTWYLIYLISIKIHKLSSTLFKSCVFSLGIISGLLIAISGEPATGGLLLISLTATGYYLDSIKTCFAVISTSATIQCIYLFNINQKIALEEMGIWVVLPIALSAAFGYAARVSTIAKHTAERSERKAKAANETLKELIETCEVLAANSERHRIALDLHDNLGHHLTTISVQMELIDMHLRKGNLDLALLNLQKASDYNQRGLHSLRSCVKLLHEQQPTHNLEKAIAQVLDIHDEGRLIFETMGKTKSCSPIVDITLLHIAKEGITNALKHSSATKIKIFLEYFPDQIKLTVSDNGKGSKSIVEGFGISGIKERVSLLHGRVYITSKIDNGYQLQVTIPYQ